MTIETKEDAAERITPYDKRQAQIDEINDFMVERYSHDQSRSKNGFKNCLARRLTIDFSTIRRDIHTSILNGLRLYVEEDEALNLGSGLDWATTMNEDVCLDMTDPELEEDKTWQEVSSVFVDSDISHIKRAFSMGRRSAFQVVLDCLNPKRGIPLAFYSRRNLERICAQPHEQSDSLTRYTFPTKLQGVHFDISFAGTAQTPTHRLLVGKV